MSLERGRYYAILGSLVVRERKRKRLAQTALAKSVGISQSTLSRIEAGKHNVEVTLFTLLTKTLFRSRSSDITILINHLATKMSAAERVIRPVRIASRDAERALIDYIVEVKT